MKNLVGELFGNYRLTRLLGRGGFAEVYLGEHQRLKTQAAIKVLFTQLSEGDVESFLSEYARDGRYNGVYGTRADSRETTSCQ